MDLALHISDLEAELASLKRQKESWEMKRMDIVMRCRATGEDVWENHDFQYAVQESIELTPEIHRIKHLLRGARVRHNRQQAALSSQHPTKE